MIDEHSGLFEQPKIEVVQSQQSGRSCCGRFVARLQELRTFDTEKYIDMLAGDQIFEVPSDHQE